MATSSEVTRLLKAWSAGDRSALDQLMPLIYEQLRRMAKHYMAQQDARHTLQPTALINEAYIRLMGASAKTWENRAQFFGVAAKAMRSVLVDYARRTRSQKRGGGDLF